VRDYTGVRGMPVGDLERTRRELAASLALARPGSPVRVPIEASLSAIDAELVQRASCVLRVCGCAFATDNDAHMDGHLWNNPGHQERDLSRYQDVAIVVVDRG
jgi:hypothetical protein